MTTTQIVAGIVIALVFIVFFVVIPWIIVTQIDGDALLVYGVGLMLSVLVILAAFTLARSIF